MTDASEQDDRDADRGNTDLLDKLLRSGNDLAKEAADEIDRIAVRCAKMREKELTLRRSLRLSRNQIRYLTTRLGDAISAIVDGGLVFGPCAVCGKPVVHTGASDRPTCEYCDDDAMDID